jgi:hypothetical protein
VLQNTTYARKLLLLHCQYLLIFDLLLEDYALLKEHNQQEQRIHPHQYQLTRRRLLIDLYEDF